MDHLFWMYHSCFKQTETMRKSPLFACVAVLGLVAYVIAESPRTCGITDMAPSQPNALSFCYQYNTNSCCVPGLDQENLEMFTTLTDVGLSCRLPGEIRDHPMAQLYCLNCDPNQPRFVRNMQPFDSESKRGYDKPYAMLLCEPWVTARFREEYQNLSSFDACGFLKSSPCLGIGPDGEEHAIGDRDRYTCGDDIVIPSAAYGNGGSDDELEAFFNDDSMATPNLDEDHLFFIVNEANCTDVEAYSDLMPRCLLNKEQLTNRRTYFAEFVNGTRNCTLDTDTDFSVSACAEFDALNAAGDYDPAMFEFELEMQDEMCFKASSAFHASLSFVAVAMAVVVALFANF
eukprot:m.353965 g.353965  ORF g.353965 m.353965 type:complete len:345 (+) comp16874_c0_seq1:131-1165(+)